LKKSEGKKLHELAVGLGKTTPLTVARKGALSFKARHLQQTTQKGGEGYPKWVGLKVTFNISLVFRCIP